MLASRITPPRARNKRLGTDVVGPNQGQGIDRPGALLESNLQGSTRAAPGQHVSHPYRLNNDSVELS